MDHPFNAPNVTECKGALTAAPLRGPSGPIGPADYPHEGQLP